jgi:muramoyltetrapeptide carboxypeptidase
MTIAPPYLEKGDKIGIVCPAGYMDMQRVVTCIETLKNWGYQVQTGRTVGNASPTYFSGTDEERLADLQEMLDDDSIHAILCGRGGYGTGRIIDALNFKEFRKRPKWIIGFSDITILHSHINRNYRIATLHAPMAGAFNEEGFMNEFVLSLRNALEGRPAEYRCAPHFLNRIGKASGELTGGNLSILAHLTGTRSDIKTNGKILFLEDVGEYLYNTDRMLYQLKRSGKLDKLGGLIIGGFTDMKDTTRPFGKNAYEMIHDIVKEYDYPVCFGFPVSHAPDNYALKTGMKYKLRITGDTVVLAE